MKSAHPMAGTGKIDHLVNHCHLDAAFYTCEQVVNGKPFTLVIFVPGQEPGHYYTQAVLANGRATGRTSLIIAGSHWTYSGNGPDAAGKLAFYRTENYFTGADAIHFEQYGSSGQKTWTKKNEGDEIRLKSSDLPAKN